MASTHYTVKSTSYTASNGHVIKEKHTSAGNETWNALGKSTEASSCTYTYWFCHPTIYVQNVKLYHSRVWRRTARPYLSVFVSVHRCLSQSKLTLQSLISDPSQKGRHGRLPNTRIHLNERKALFVADGESVSADRPVCLASVCRVSRLHLLDQFRAEPRTPGRVSGRRRSEVNWSDVSLWLVLPRLWCCWLARTTQIQWNR